MMPISGKNMRALCAQIEEDINIIEQEVRLLESDSTSGDQQAIITIKRNMLVALRKIRRTAKISSWSWIAVPALNVLVINGLVGIVGGDVSSWSTFALLIIITLLAIGFSNRAVDAWVVANTKKHDDELLHLEDELQKILR